METTQNVLQALHSRDELPSHRNLSTHWEEKPEVRQGLFLKDTFSFILVTGD